MIMGPCGGVRPDGGCEVPPHPCVFPAPVSWPDPVPPVPLGAVPLILSDFSSKPYSQSAHAAVAGILAPVSDAVLVGEHQDRPDFPPALLASILLGAGARPWITLSCRDRNRVVLEQELRGLRQLGVDAVLCVTGDARASDVRPDVTQVFDLDGPRLAALAASIGLAEAAVPGDTRRATPAPAALPTGSEAARRGGGRRAQPRHRGVGGQLHGRRRAGRGHHPGHRRGPLFSPIPCPSSALARLPGLELDPAMVHAVLDNPDPVAAGISAAAEQARALLAIPGVAGVNISGLASARGHEFAARIKAELAERIREGAPRDL